MSNPAVGIILMGDMPDLNKQWGGAKRESIIVKPIDEDADEEGGEASAVNFRLLR